MELLRGCDRTDYDGLGAEATVVTARKVRALLPSVSVGGTDHLWR